MSRGPLEFMNIRTISRFLRIASLLMLLVAVAVLLASAVARPCEAQPSPEEAYCCLCAGCPGAGCVLVDVVPPCQAPGEPGLGTANVGGACPTFCPMDCQGSRLVAGTCAEHTVAECPVVERAPALSPWALAVCVAALGVFGIRRARRS